MLVGDCQGASETSDYEDWARGNPVLSYTSSYISKNRLASVIGSDGNMDGRVAQVERRSELERRGWGGEGPGWLCAPATAKLSRGTASVVLNLCSGPH